MRVGSAAFERFLRMNEKRDPARVTVLLVDDDPEFRDVMTSVLSEEGCRVAQAEDGARALELLKVLTPDLIITDLVMPAMSGWEFVRNLGSDERLAHIPVTVLSAWASESPPQVAHVFKKPVDLPNLIGVLDAVAEIRAYAR
jgi:CheY-like chemotaxis protein